MCVKYWKIKQRFCCFADIQGEERDLVNSTFSVSRLKLVVVATSLMYWLRQIDWLIE